MPEWSSIPIQRRRPRTSSAKPTSEGRSREEEEEDEEQTEEQEEEGPLPSMETLIEIQQWMTPTPGAAPLPEVESQIEVIELPGSLSCLFLSKKSLSQR